MKERIELGIELERLFIFEFLRKVNWERRRSRVCNQVLTLLKTTSLGIKSVEVGRSAEWSNFTRVQCVQLTIIVENDHRSIWISIKIFFYTKQRGNSTNFPRYQITRWLASITSSSTLRGNSRSSKGSSMSRTVPFSLASPSLSLSRSAQKQRQQQRSGDRLGHWIPKVLSHVTRKLPIHVPVRRFILRKHPTSQQTRTPLRISIISISATLWAWLSAISLTRSVIGRLLSSDRPGR